MPLKVTEIELIFKQELSEDIKDIAIQKGGVSSTTHLILTRSNKPYYIKENNNNHKLELELTKKLTKAGIPLPKIICVGDAWMIMESINGIPLREVSDKKIKINTLRESGKFLAILNSFKVKGFGPLIDSTTGTYNSYFSFYEALYNKLQPWQQPLVFEYLDSVTESFISHGDIAQSHIFVDKTGNFEAFIDIDDILGGPFYYDLAEFDAGNEFDEELWKAFSESYAQVAKPPKQKDINFLIEKYLITFDSYNWYLKQPNHEFKFTERINKDLKRMAILEKQIWG